MNCNPQNRTYYLAARIRSWREVAECGVDRYERARGRRNFWRLVLAHPGIAADCGVRALATGTRRP